MMNFGFAVDCLRVSNCASLLARLVCFDEWPIMIASNAYLFGSFGRGVQQPSARRPAGVDCA
jgi:hypothetical protein